MNSAHYQYTINSVFVFLFCFLSRVLDFDLKFCALIKSMTWPVSRYIFLRCLRCGFCLGSTGSLRIPYDWGHWDLTGSLLLVCRRTWPNLLTLTLFMSPADRHFELKALISFMKTIGSGSPLVLRTWKSKFVERKPKLTSTLEVHRMCTWPETE